MVVAVNVLVEERHAARVRVDTNRESRNAQLILLLHAKQFFINEQLNASKMTLRLHLSIRLALVLRNTTVVASM